MSYGHVIVGVSLLVATLVGTVRAAEPQAAQPSAERTALCTNEAEFAEEVAGRRDQGMPSSEVIAAVQSTGRQPLPGVSVTVQEDVAARWTAMIKAIYARPGRTPAQEKQAAYEACLERPAP